MTIVLGGEAGQGVESSGQGFASALTRAGFHLFGLQDYMSRIRGGYNFSSISIGEMPLHSHETSINLLMAFSPEAIATHAGSMVVGGGVIFDESMKIVSKLLEERQAQMFPVPLRKMAEEIGGNKIMINTAAIGAASGLTGFPYENIARVIEDSFGRRKGRELAQANLNVARAAYDYAQKHYCQRFAWRLEPKPFTGKKMLMNGNQALCVGAVAAGCKFISAYPMTPASTIIEWMSAHAKNYGIVTKHTEDEIAAVLMAIGASYAGVRAMTATSGGGFSLMVEALGMSGMTETPVVIVVAQRAGPSTGLPTRQEQGDLLFALHASQGDFPRIVLAPSTIEECFTFGWRAFNLAEKYQCPVIILTDQFLASSFRSIAYESIDFNNVVLDRGLLLNEDEIAAFNGDYKRHEITPNGISPRAFPGHPKAIVRITSDEHNEFGHMEDEDPENRIRQMDKRQRKMTTCLADMNLPKEYGPKSADVTLVGWGSSYGVLRGVVDRTNAAGGSVNLLHFIDIWPLDEAKLLAMMGRIRFMICVENNQTAQFARYLRSITGRKADAFITRYDGRPLSCEYVLAGLDAIIKKDKEVNILV